MFTVFANRFSCQFHRLSLIKSASLECFSVTDFTLLPPLFLHVNIMLGRIYLCLRIDLTFYNSSFRLINCT